MCEIFVWYFIISVACNWYCSSKRKNYILLKKKEIYFAILRRHTGAVVVCFFLFAIIKVSVRWNIVVCAIFEVKPKINFNTKKKYHKVNWFGKVFSKPTTTPSPRYWIHFMNWVYIKAVKLWGSGAFFLPPQGMYYPVCRFSNILYFTVTSRLLCLLFPKKNGKWTQRYTLYLSLWHFGPSLRVIFLWFQCFSISTIEHMSRKIKFIYNTGMVYTSLIVR